MIKSNNGYSSIFFVVLVLIILIAYIGLNKLLKKPSPEPTINFSPSATTKQKLYEQNKEQIKADLNMTEEEFQILKRFSED